MLEIVLPVIWRLENPTVTNICGLPADSNSTQPTFIGFDKLLGGVAMLRIFSFEVNPAGTKIGGNACMIFKASFASLQAGSLAPLPDVG